MILHKRRLFPYTWGTTKCYTFTYVRILSHPKRYVYFILGLMSHYSSLLASYAGFIKHIDACVPVSKSTLPPSKDCVLKYISELAENAPV